MGASEILLLPSEEEEISVGMGRSDLGSWEWLGMIRELEYR